MVVVICQTHLTESKAMRKKRLHIANYNSLERNRRVLESMHSLNLYSQYPNDIPVRENKDI